MSKTLCKYSRKEIAENPVKIYRLVEQARFMCGSCARVAHDESSLCRPTAMMSACANDTENSLAQGVHLLRSVSKKSLKKALKERKAEKKNRDGKKNSEGKRPKKSSKRAA